LFWTPAFAGGTTQETFYESINIEGNLQTSKLSILERRS